MAKITLYTNHYCPWAHRVHIALAELGIDFEEVIIDLSRPREPWYLEINPKGLVPSIKYDDEIITDSAIITQFLADAYPSALLPPTTTPGAALRRARIAAFVDTFVAKVSGVAVGMLSADKTQEARDACGRAMIAAVKSDLAPMLSDAAPFFGGSKELTLAEVNTGAVLVRLYSLTKKEYGLLPEYLVEELRVIEPWQRWVDAVLAKESVTKIYVEADNAKLWQLKVAEAAAKVAEAAAKV